MRKLIIIIRDIEGLESYLSERSNLYDSFIVIHHNEKADSDSFQELLKLSERYPVTIRTWMEPYSAERAKQICDVVMRSECSLRDQVVIEDLLAAAKKERAIAVGVYNLFDPLCTMLTSLKANLTLPFDLVVFHDGITSEQRIMLERLNEPTRFIDYTKFRDAGFSFTHMTMARYECFNLLKEYKQVLWLDVDIIVRRNIDDLFSHTLGMWAMVGEKDVARNFRTGCLPSELIGHEKEDFFNAGVLLLNDDIERYETLESWCTRKTQKLLRDLLFPDQGILNLMVRIFGIKVGDIGLTYNYSRLYDKTRPELLDPHIVHFVFRPKPWEKGSFFPGKPDHEVAVLHHGGRWVAEWHHWNSVFHNKRVFLVSTIGAEVTILAQFLAHYANLGVTKFLIVANARSEDDPILVDIKKNLEGYEHALVEWVGPFSENTKTAKERALILAECRPEDWVIYADLDEFQEYPKKLGEVLRECSEKGLEYLTVGWVTDRVARDGSFPALGDGPLAEAFPIKCLITKNVIGALSRKIVLARARIQTWWGHHNIVSDRPDPIPERTKLLGLDPASGYPVVVNHYKWHAAGVQALRDRVRDMENRKLEFSEVYWLEESKKTLKYIDENDGKINMSDPRLCVE